MVGIIQEQHPDRARLFMQWKRMDWPVLVDSPDWLEVSYVPITLLIDEHGVIRRIVAPRSDPSAAVSEFLAAEFEPPDDLPHARSDVSPPAPAGAAPPDDTAAAWRERADRLLVWSPASGLDEAIEAYGRSLALDPEDGWTHFRAGVAYRARADSPGSRAGDFARAVEQWSIALEIDPDNYIWRRRLQQYGPRLEKPYPFYDWVARAREEIEARDETPVELAVEPRGAELAPPARSFVVDADSDARVRERDDRIQRDDGKLVKVETVVVPPVLRAGASARVHLAFRPEPSSRAHWNNEVRGLVLWIDPPRGWQVDRQRIELDNPAARLGPASEEVRRVEFEVQSPAGVRGDTSLPAYALYYVCEGLDGPCLYRRQDVEVRLEVAEP